MKETGIGALAELIPPAVAIAISPLPIVAAVAVALSKAGRRGGLIFAGVFVATAFAAALITGFGADAVKHSSSDGPHPIALVFSAIFATLFAVLAVLSWRSRPLHGQEAAAPRWLTAVDGFSPARVALLALTMAATNSKNLPLELKAGAVIGTVTREPVLIIGLALLFAVLASITVLLPAVAAASGSTGVVGALHRVKDEMIRHNAIILTVLFAVLASLEVQSLLKLLIR